jgi:hypothetical protein
VFKNLFRIFCSFSLVLFLLQNESYLVFNLKSLLGPRDGEEGKKFLYSFIFGKTSPRSHYDVKYFSWHIGEALPTSSMFLGLLDPDPDPLVRGTDPDPSSIKQN